VKNMATGEIVPSCATIGTAGMKIDASSDEVKHIRTLSLELLLGDHRADCEAPCSTVCPYGLDVERMLGMYDAGRHGRAYELIAEAFTLPELGCDNCKVPCEKVCRRGSVDRAIAIRAVIREVVGEQKEYKEQKEHEGHEGHEKHENPLPVDAPESIRTGKKDIFNSRLGRFTEREKEWLRTNTATASGCLHCVCDAKDDCRLREIATGHSIKTTRYTKESVTQALMRRKIGHNLWFEQAKCVKCGLCVYNTTDGFTFSGRGYAMRVVLPEESESNVPAKIAQLCPVGAIYVK